MVAIVDGQIVVFRWGMNSSELCINAFSRYENQKDLNTVLIFCKIIVNCNN